MADLVHYPIEGSISLRTLLRLSLGLWLNLSWLESNLCLYRAFAIFVVVVLGAVVVVLGGVVLGFCFDLDLSLVSKIEEREHF